jgi:catechol 2,3-dioxygenase-like lactoylglutathione lyase family enzyme
MTDVARSVAFYQKLGFSEAYRNDRSVMMTAANAHLFIFATALLNRRDWHADPVS